MKQKKEEGKESKHSMEKIERAPEFHKVFLGLVLVIAVSFSIMYIGSINQGNQGSDNSGNNAFSEIKTTKITAMAVNDKITGMITSDICKKGGGTYDDKTMICTITGASTSGDKSETNKIIDTKLAKDSKDASPTPSSPVLFKTEYKYTPPTSTSAPTTPITYSIYSDMGVNGCGEGCKIVLDDKDKTTYSYKPGSAWFNAAPGVISIEVTTKDGKTTTREATAEEKKNLPPIKEITENLKSHEKQNNERTAKYIKDTGQRPPEMQAQIDAEWNQIIGNTRGKINTILNAYVDEYLGEFTQGVPAAVCGDSLYKKEQSPNAEKKKVLGIDVPQSSYGSEMERKILEDTKTVIIEGEKTEVTEQLYRYGITVKMIGGKTSEEWRMWLYNSCTKKSSYAVAKETEGAGWYEYGALSSLQFFGNHYAFQLDCSGGTGYCRYNKVCIAFSGGGALLDNAAPSQCVSLTHGGGFISAETCDT